MSTRSNILIKDEYSSLLFYRHSDGYPTGQKTLLKFMDMVKEGKIRNNVSQSTGWLIVFGYFEYKKYHKTDLTDWKVGAYEPTDCNNIDIDYFYVCDLIKLEIKVYSAELWNSKLGKEGLKSEKNIKKCIEKGWLKEIGTITDFENIKVLEKMNLS